MGKFGRTTTPYFREAIQLNNLKFFTASTDGKGHGKTLHVQVPPSLAARLADFVAARIIPQYRTREDVVRDAIVKLLCELEHAGSDYPPFRFELLAAEIRRAETELEAVRMSVGDMRRALRTGIATKPDIKDAAQDLLNRQEIPAVREAVLEFLDEL